MSRFPRSCIVPFDPIRALASSTSSSKELHNQIALFWTTVQQTKQCQGQMAFWLPSLLPLAYPQLQTLMQKTQIWPVQTQTSCACAQETHQDPWIQPATWRLFCPQLPLLSWQIQTRESSWKVVRSIPLLCSRAHNCWDLPGKCCTSSQTLPFSNTTTKRTPVPALSLPHRALSPTFPAVFPVTISGSIPRFSNARGWKEEMQPERCLGKGETLLAEQAGFLLNNGCFEASLCLSIPRNSSHLLVLCGG